MENKFVEGEIILIDKPLYWTSFNVVKRVGNIIKKRYNIKKLKVGHAGTLDPLATGLLVICTGRKTKEISTFQDSIKEYIASIEFGKTTPSYDLETKFDGVFPFDHIKIDLIKDKLKKFIGEISQVPPLYSAKFIDGRRAYKLARKGSNIVLQPNKVTIKELEIIEFTPPELVIRIVCSKGTYIRTLAYDIGKALNSGAYLKSLRRTISGMFQIKDALNIDEFQENLFSLQP